MDLRKLKTVFILILIIANVFMSWMIHDAQDYEEKEKNAMVNNVSDILAKEMIFLPDSLVLPETPKADNYFLEKMFGSTEEMIVKFLGTEYEKLDGGSYASDMGTLFVNGNEFIYRKSAVGTSVQELSDQQIEGMCRAEMKRLGMMDDAYSFSGFNQIPEGRKAIFTVKHNNSEFFDAYVSFDVTSSGIAAIGGKNIISDLEVSETSNVYPDVEGVLVGLIKSEKLMKNVAHNIISIKHGYYIGESEESYRNILAIPVWQIAVESGQILHFDARNGKELD